jgi:hypothetical protein
LISSRIFSPTLFLKNNRPKPISRGVYPVDQNELHWNAFVEQESVDPYNFYLPIDNESSETHLIILKTIEGEIVVIAVEREAMIYRIKLEPLQSVFDQGVTIEEVDLLLSYSSTFACTSDFLFAVNGRYEYPLIYLRVKRI